MNYNRFLNNKNILKEGGSFGRISFIYESHDLSFTKLREILNMMIDGSISKLGAEIKTDGTNLMMSYKDDDFIFARAGKHLRDFGTGALKSPDELKDYLNKIPDEVSESFRLAAVDMVSALSKVDTVVLSQIFGDGEKWLSFEIINPITKNVLDYQQKSIFIQTIIKVNETGKHIDDDRKLVKLLWEQIEKAGAEHQKSFVIKPMKAAVFNTNPKADEEKAETKKYLDNFYAEYDLKETDRIRKYIETWWKRYIEANSDTTFEEDELEVLIDRFVNGKVDLRLTDFEKYYGKNTVAWIKSIDKLGKTLNYLAIDPIRFLHDSIGHRSLSRLKTHLSVDQSKTEATFRTDFKEKIKWVQSLPKDDDLRKRFDRDFIRLNKHVELETFTIAEEGYTYFYDGYIKKQTGYFSFINQLFGVGKYK